MNDFEVLRQWAKDKLEIGGTPRLPCILQESKSISERITVHKVKWLECSKPFYLCRHCEPFPVRDVIIPDSKSEIDKLMKEYTSVINDIAQKEITLSLLNSLFELCYNLHYLTDLEGKRKGLTRQQLRYIQKGKCIVPDCNKYRQLHLHRCLPGYLGGEYTAENCVLVCAQHHPKLEDFKSKAEVMEYVSRNNTENNKLGIL